MTPLNRDSISRAPKVLLHDHLDGGLRPQTVLELADEAGYRDLPADDADSLGRWFRQAADSGSLVRYLETFAHTVGVMQTPDAIHRVARECALDLAADGVVYAEVRFAPELSTAQGLAIEAVVEAIGDDSAAELRMLTMEVYDKAHAIARERGIILADTKLEFGRRPDGTTILADEVLTPDSSRFWPADEWQPGRAQSSYDKQIVRDWLTGESGWDRTSGEAPPPPRVRRSMKERTLLSGWAPTKASTGRPPKKA